MTRHAPAVVHPCTDIPPIPVSEGWVHYSVICGCLHRSAGRTRKAAMAAHLEHVDGAR